MVESTRPTLHFGNGVEAKAHKIESAKVEKDGQLWVAFWIEPTQELLDYYERLGIKDKLIDGRFVYRKYPKKWVERVNDDPIINVIRIKCGFDWEPTTLTDDSYKDEIISQQQKTIRELKRFLANQGALLEKMAKRPTAYIKHIAEMGKEILKLTGPRNNNMMLEEDYQQGDIEGNIVGGGPDAR